MLLQIMVSLEKIAQHLYVNQMYFVMFICRICKASYTLSEGKMDKFCFVHLKWVKADDLLLLELDLK